MKDLRGLVFAILLAVQAQAQPAYLTPSNAPPVVQLTWDLAAGMSYNVYYGVVSGGYTNKVAVGATNYARIVLPARGCAYFFAATAVANGLESGFSREVSFTPAVPPAPPENMRAPVVLSVEWKPAGAEGRWAEAGLNWCWDADATNALFRLRIDRGTDLALR
jgi:hypothetical protein